MAEKYFVIHRSEDEPNFRVFDRSGLKKALEDGDDGVLHGKDIIEKAGDIDLEYFPENSVLIIKGEVVVPRAKKTVVEFDL